MKKIYLITIFLVLSVGAFAQTANTLFYRYAPALTNPAMIVRDEGLLLRAYFGFTAYLEDNHMKSFFYGKTPNPVNIFRQKAHLYFGLHFMIDSRPEFDNWGLILPIAAKLDLNHGSYLSLGLNLGVEHRELKSGPFITESQYDTLTGLFNPLASNNELLITSELKGRYVLFSPSVFWSTGSKWKDTELFAGFTAFNANNPQKSGGEIKEPLPRNLTSIIGLKKSIAKQKYSLTGNFNWSHLENYNYWELGLSLKNERKVDQIKWRTKWLQPALQYTANHALRIANDIEYTSKKGEKVIMTLAVQHNPIVINETRRFLKYSAEVGVAYRPPISVSQFSRGYLHFKTVIVSSEGTENRSLASVIQSVKALGPQRKRDKPFLCEIYYTTKSHNLADSIKRSLQDDQFIKAHQIRVKKVDEFSTLANKPINGDKVVLVIHHNQYNGYE